MADNKYIVNPFAVEGDTKAIPDPIQGDGTVSWAQGFGPDYQRDLKTDSKAKAIQRQDMNRLFFVITSILKQYQERAFPEWISSDKNNGQPYPYTIGATVSYVNSNGDITYWSNTRANNTNEPGGTGWSPFIYRTATSGEVDKRTGKYPVTPSQVATIFNALLEFPAASTSKAGIVQLSNALDSVTQSSAATPRAVSFKLTHQKSGLAQQNLNELNTFASRGIYYQNDATLATTERNYPEQETGVLLALGMVGGAPLQMYVSASGRLFTRVDADSDGNYGVWRQIEPPLPVATDKVAGVTKLSNDGDSTATNIAATPMAVSSRVANRGSLGSKDLDTLTSSSDQGLYYQGAASQATTDRGYPVAVAGVLQCIGSIGGAPMQTYTSFTGRIFTRSYISTDSAWRDWNEVSPAQPRATTSQLGITRLSEDLNSSANNLAATPKAVRQKLTYLRSGLGDQDINVKQDPDSDAGVFYQTSDAKATSAKGYPIAEAGTLLVTGNVNGWPVQTYIASSSGRVFTRRRASSNNTEWASWKEPVDRIPAGAIIPMAKRGDGTAPDGYLVCNGASLPRATYPDLFASIGTRYGSKSNTTFNLPNFAAGDSILANNGSSSYAVAQTGAIKRHRHVGSSGSAGVHNHPGSSTGSAGQHNHPHSSTGRAGKHAHPLTTYLVDDRSGVAYICRTTRTRAGAQTVNTGDAGLHDHPLSIARDGLHNHTVTIARDGNHVHPVTVNETGGDKNLAAGQSMLICIKF